MQTPITSEMIASTVNWSSEIFIDHDLLLIFNKIIVNAIQAVKQHPITKYVHHGRRSPMRTPRRHALTHGTQNARQHHHM